MITAQQALEQALIHGELPSNLTFIRWILNPVSLQEINKVNFVLVVCITGFYLIYDCAYNRLPLPEDLRCDSNFVLLEINNGDFSFFHVYSYGFQV